VGSNPTLSAIYLSVDFNVQYSILVA